MTAPTSSSTSPAALRKLLHGTINELLKLDTKLSRGMRSTTPTELSSRLLALSGLSSATLHEWPALPIDPEQLGLDLLRMQLERLRERVDRMPDPASS